MKSPTKLPRRYGRRRTYNRSPKTQILSRKRVPVDVEVDGDVSVSPLDDRDSTVEVDKKSGGTSSEATESIKKNDSKKVAEFAKTGKENRIHGGKSIKRSKIRGSLVDNILPAPPIQSKSTKTNSLLISNPNEFTFFQKDDTSTSSEKACSRDKSQHYNPDKNLLLDLFPNDASTNKSANTNHSSGVGDGTSKKSSTTTAKVASEGKSGIITGASASTARTKNTSLRLAPRKKTPGRSKFKKGSPKVKADAVGILESMKELKEVPVGRIMGLPPPENITFRSKSKGKVEELMAAPVGDVQIWQDEGDDGVSVLTGATKMKRVLRDVANRVKGGEAETTGAKIKKPVQSEFRTKTARQKRKSTLEEIVERKKQCVGKIDACVIFTVPQFESRRDGTDRFQERKYLGLIEGVGGGIDEANKPDDTPSRGRLLEMPGELMPGTWKAQVLDDETEGCSYKRISLRHENVEYSSLEARLQEDNVSIVNPHKNRVTSFIDQEILYDEEIDDTEGEEKVLGKVFIGCVSLVWFDGFYTSTDAIKLANETSEGLLKLCVPPEDSGANSLCKIVRKDLSGKSDDFDCVGGVLYRCKLDFDDEYTILLSYSGFEIDAVDVIFKKIDVHSCMTGGVLDVSCRRGLTPSIISHHLDCVGSTECDVMGRWINGDDEKYSYLPPTDEKLVYQESASTEQSCTKEESDHLDESAMLSNTSFTDFGDGAHDTFDPEEKDNEDSDPLVTDVQKSQELPSINHSDVVEEVEEVAEHKPRDPSFENHQANESATATKHSTSPVLEAVKKRAYTTIHCQQDVEAEIDVLPQRSSSTVEPTAISNSPHKTLTVMRSAQSKAIQDLSLPASAVEIMPQIDAQDHIKHGFTDTSNHTKSKGPTIDIVTKAAQSSEEQHELKVSTTDRPATFKPSNNSASEESKEPMNSIAVGSSVKHSTNSNDGIAYINTANPSCSVLAKGTKSLSKPIAKKATKASENKKTNRRLSYACETKLTRSKFKRAHTPTTKQVAMRTDSATSTARKLFDTSSKNDPQQQLHFSAAKSTKKKEYINDLFGENESMFGIPTIKTPLARRRSVGGSHGKTLSRFSRPKPVSGSRSAPSKTRQMPLPPTDSRSKASKDTSPVVTPGRKSIGKLSDVEEVFHSPVSPPSINKLSSFDEDTFHDASMVLFDESKDEFQALSAIGLQEAQQYSSPQRLHDVYYGQAAPSPTPTLAVLSSNISTMESPDRFGSFHDYYYGHGHYVESEDSFPIPSDQPLHDVYFGQYMQCEQLVSEELNVSPDSSQSTYDIYFGQQEIQACSNIQKPRAKYQHKLFLVLLALSRMFHAATQPVNTRYQRRHPGITVFTQTHSNNTHTENEIIDQGHQAQGWFSAWYQGY